MRRTVFGSGVFAATLGLVGISIAGCGQSMPTATTTSDSVTVCPTTLVSQACVSTCAQTQTIVEASCAPCHQAPDGAFIQGAPLTFILDGPRLAMQSSVSRKQERYLIPGDPNHSLIYQRTAIARNMPPDQTEPSVPRPTVSDLSVLREWIAACVLDGAAGGGAGGI